MGNFDLIDDYIQPHLSSSNGKVAKRVAFIINFTNWELSNQGDYIEYEIEIEYKEGEGKKWIILRRYSEFVHLHESLTDFFLRKK